MPYSSITGWGLGKMNVLLILIAGLMLAGAETILKSADFKPAKNDQMIEVFEAAKSTPPLEFELVEKISQRVGLP